MSESPKESVKDSPKPDTPKSPLCDKKSVRKLSKGMRIANYIYQILMVVMSGTMLLLGQLDSAGIHISESVFKVFSVVMGVIPVIWTNVLNLFKKNVEGEQK